MLNIEVDVRITDKMSPSEWKMSQTGTEPHRDDEGKWGEKEVFVWIYPVWRSTADREQLLTALDEGQC